MFYKYFKSIYNIVKKCSPDSDIFKDMLKLNDYFINNLNNIQKGGKKLMVIKIVSLDKSILLNKNNIQSGGTIHEEIQKLNSTIQSIILNVETNKQISDKNIESFNKLYNFLNDFVNSLSRKIDNHHNITELTNQLNEINVILSKY